MEPMMRDTIPFGRAMMNSHVLCANLYTRYIRYKHLNVVEHLEHGQQLRLGVSIVFHYDEGA